MQSKSVENCRVTKTFSFSFFPFFFFFVSKNVSTPRLIKFAVYFILFFFIVVNNNIIPGENKKIRRQDDFHMPSKNVYYTRPERVLLVVESPYAFTILH